MPAKRRAKPGGAVKKKKPMGPGMTRHPRVQGGALPGPGAAASLIRTAGTILTRTQVGDALRSGGQMGLGATHEMTRDVYRDTYHKPLPGTKPGPKFMPRDTSKKPTLIGKKKRGSAGTARTM